MQYNLLKKMPRKTPLFLGTMGIIVALDQFFKYKIRHNGGFYLCNNGISFGIQLPNIIFWLTIGLFFLLMLTCFVFLYKKGAFFKLTTTTFLGITFFIGGTLSNTMDRLWFGCVLDYISLFRPLPIFNLADVSIFLGSFFLLAFLFFKKQ